jgi:4-hydroxy-2-oxoheptanedioate aldolase
MPLRLSPTFRDRLAAGTARPCRGWVCTGSPLVAEIMAGSGLDWLLIDMEHPNTTRCSRSCRRRGSPRHPVVRVPVGDVVTIKQVLDLGAQNILVPMVSSAAEAAPSSRRPRYRRAADAASAPPSRSARWNRVDDYLANADAYVSVFVQIETAAGSMPRPRSPPSTASTASSSGRATSPPLGLLGQQTHPDVTAGVLRAFAAVRAAGKPVGVNAFDPAVAQSYIDAGRPSCSSAPTWPSSPAARRPSPRGGSRRRTTPRAPGTDGARDGPARVCTTRQQSLPVACARTGQPMAAHARS